MKAIQFQKTNCQLMGGNFQEITSKLGGTIAYIGKCGSTDIQKTYERDNQTFPLQFDDWIVDIDGVILVLSDIQYQAFISLLSPNKALDFVTGGVIRNLIAKERSQGGLLSSKHPDDHCTTDIESCKKRLKDQHGFVKSTQPRIIEMSIKWDNSNDEQS
ncbi:hypothetical protein [Acinetobacter sp.]|uniref:hypothetical protein n=1 Tax=Acinetobacter sp. TaxID=472 RepID=UPI003982AAE1